MEINEKTALTETETTENTPETDAEAAVPTDEEVDPTDDSADKEAYMNLTPLQKKAVNKACLKVLKLPGNTMKGDVLEMTLVVDCALDKEYICERAKEILTSLRSEGKSFLNLRLNLVKWKGDEDFIKYVSSYPDVLMGRTADEKDIAPDAVKYLDNLTAQLKKFYARSRIHLLLLKEEYGCENPLAVYENLNPFLHKKMVAVLPDATIINPFTVKEPDPQSLPAL